MAPVGGREAREKATAPLPGVTDPDMGGQFNNKNPGKRGISLNVRHPKGLEIAKRLVAMSDIVAEGFSPGVLDNWGLGYDAMRAIKPDIIYVQQSGMGAQGTYGRFRTVGPIANSFAGLSEMSGLPEPAMPAGWGYSYLDWMGAYSFALAMLMRALPPRSHGRGAVDRRLAVRGRPLHQRHHHPRLVGQRAHLVALRQPVAAQARGAARRLSVRAATIAGSPSRASPRRNGSALRQGRGPPGVGDDARFADLAARLRAPGCARRADRRLDASRRTPTRRCSACSRPACRPASARRRRTAATAIRSCSARMADRGDRHEDRPRGRSPRCRSR